MTLEIVFSYQSQTHNHNMLQDICTFSIRKIFKRKPLSGSVSILFFTHNSQYFAIIDKRRVRAGISEVMNIIGDVSGRTCILVDDLVDSAGTLCHAAAALREAGAVRVVAYCSHGVLSGQAVERVAQSAMAELVVSDSIEATQAVLHTPRLRQLSIAPLLAEAIKRISLEQSVSSLLD